MTADTIGGVWNYALDLSKGLRAYDVEIHLATMGKLLDGPQLKKVKEIDHLILYESDYKLEWMTQPWQDVAAARQWLQQIAADIKPDLIHFNNYGQVSPGWEIPTITVAHSCVLSWWRAVKQEEAPGDWDTYKKLVSAAFRASDFVVAPTHSYLKEVENIYGKLRKKKAIYNGRYSLPFKYRPKEPYILAAGRIWDEAKNISALINLAGVIDWPVYIAGDNLHPVSGKIIASNHVHFLGLLSQEELSDWMERASIFVSPALYEPFGLSVLEAAHSGCALVLSDIPTFNELWDDAALFVNPRDFSGLREVIDTLIRDNTLRQEWSRKARTRSSEFSAKTMARHYYKIYKNLAVSDRINKNNLLTSAKA